MPAVFNAANEYAVAAFLEGRLPFLGIYDVIADTMESHKKLEHPSVNQILEAQRWAEEHIRSRFQLC
jgi:1-deoxy-D-xylulose-5-phosphate reductoisomerase